MNEFRTPQNGIYALWDYIQTDSEYHSMLMALRELESKYDAIISKLECHEQDIICDYVSLCEGMSWRALEIAYHVGLKE